MANLSARCLLATAAMLALAGADALAQPNVAPTTPTITQPSTDGRSLAVDDVHLESSVFADTNAADTHACTDFEIWTLVGNTSSGALQERIWFASCRSGSVAALRHASLADGAFAGTYAGRTTLLPSINYRIRIRHKDSSGDAATEWSAYATRNFVTPAPLPVAPMSVNDVAATPTPALLDAAGAAINLPGGATPATIRIEAPLPAPSGQLMLELRGQSSGGNLVTNAGTIGAPQAVRVRAIAGTSALALPPSTINFTDSLGVARSVLLPAINLAPGASGIYWVTLNGGSYTGTPAQNAPDFTSPARPATVPWTVRRPGFIAESVASGFQLPVNIAFIPSPSAAPDAPLFYVAELYGAIKLVRRNGAVSTYASGLLNFVPVGPIPGAGEQGLSGLCVHSPSGDVFASLLYESSPGGPRFNRVIRLQSLDGGVTAAETSIVLSMADEPQTGPNQVAGVSFGPDGKLYVHVGDSGDIAGSQDPASFRGKVLRLNIDGSAPADNPFYNAADGITATDYVYASGLRGGRGGVGGFGGAWRTSDGAHYMLESGLATDRISKLVRARNYLWDGTDASLSNFAMFNWSPSVRPSNIAIVQSSTFAGSGFPATLYGHGFIAESGAAWATGPQLYGKRITDVFIDAAGVAASAPVALAEYNGAGKATCAGIAPGPDGLYFTDLYKDIGAAAPADSGAGVLRIRYVGEAAFIASPEATSGPPPLQVAFSDASNVPGAVGWLWSFGDGATSTLRNPVHTYTATGCYTVRLTVTRSTGETVTAQRPGAVRVSQPAPIAFIVGDLALGAGDSVAINALRSMCYQVDVFDDEPTRRPGASQLATNYGLVVVSSTVNSSNIAGEFRTAPLPMIFWEQALLAASRETLATSTSSFAGTAINVTGATHPVMRGFTAGSLTLFNASQTINTVNGTVAAGTLSPNATPLATQPASSSSTVLVAETGAALLSGYIAPARRVFLPFSETGLSAVNTNGFTLINNSVCWAMGLNPAIAVQPTNATRPAGSTATLTVVSTGHPARTHQWRKGGVPLLDGGRISGATTPQLSISNLQASDAGSYDVVVSTDSCGSITSTAATLALGAPCPADFNNSGALSVQDIFDFLNAYFTGSPSADINGVGGLTVQDVFDYLALYFTGCP